jgi:beta-glucosidase
MNRPLSKHAVVIIFLVFSTSVFISASPKSIYHKGWIDFNKNGKMDVFEDPNASIDERIKDLLGQMNLEEKTCQMTTLYGSGRVLKDALPEESWKNEVWKDGIGNIDEEHNGIGSFKSEYSYPYTKHVQTKHTIQRWFVENTRLGIPVDFTNEGIRGLCHDRATFFPSQSGQGSTWNKELIARIAEVEAQEAIALGYTNIYSPILDIAQDPRWGRVVECYGEDPFLVGELGKQMIIGLQKNRLVSTVKHFAVYSVPVGGRDGKTRTDPHIAQREMRTLYIEPFRKAFQEAGALGVMSSYNDYDGEPVTGSQKFLTDILRKELGFKGYVVSDSRAVEFLYEKHKVAENYEDAIVQSFNAGLNIRTHFSPPADCIIPLRKAIADGKISLSTVDERVSDVLRVKFWLGLFDDPYRGDGKQAEKIVHSKAHQEVALEAAKQSLVLLKNENNFLPWSKSLKSIAVIGPNANERKQLICRYGPANAPIKTVYEGIQELLPDASVVYKKGCNIIDPNFPQSEIFSFEKTPEEKQMMEEAVETARNAEAVVLVLGGSELTVREERSRTSLDLPGRQEELLKAIYATGKPIVLVLLDGRASSINYADKHIPAILHAWFPGEFCGQAIAETLFGDYNPAGRLAVTFPKSVGQIPFAFPFKPGSDEDADTSIYGALYSFGHGLSYTSFAYSDLTITPKTQEAQGNINITCKVKNTGNRSGNEVIQLYLRDEISSVTTYVKVLRGFERVSLQAGEEKTVQFTLTPQHLGLWDKTMNFVVEPGTFKVMIGASSKDIKLEGTFAIK